MIRSPQGLDVAKEVLEIRGAFPPFPLIEQLGAALVAGDIESAREVEEAMLALEALMGRPTTS